MSASFGRVAVIVAEPWRDVSPADWYRYICLGKDSEGFPGIYPLFIPVGGFFLHNGIVGCGLQDRDRLARHAAPAECRVTDSIPNI